MLYNLIICDQELSYDEYKEEFNIGFFSSYKKAEEIARYYLKNIDGFKDYNCSYEIINRNVRGIKVGEIIYMISGWNENSEFDPIEIVNSECFTEEKEAMKYMAKMKRKYTRTNWSLDKFIVNECLWKDGFIRV